MSADGRRSEMATNGSGPDWRASRDDDLHATGLSTVTNDTQSIWEEGGQTWLNSSGQAVPPTTFGYNIGSTPFPDNVRGEPGPWDQLHGRSSLQGGVIHRSTLRSGPQFKNLGLVPHRPLRSYVDHDSPSLQISQKISPPASMIVSPTRHENDSLLYPLSGLSSLRYTSTSTSLPLDARQGDSASQNAPIGFADDSAAEPSNIPHEMARYDLVTSVTSSMWQVDSPQISSTIFDVEQRFQDNKLGSSVVCLHESKLSSPSTFTRSVSGSSQRKSASSLKEQPWDFAPGTSMSPRRRESPLLKSPLHSSLASTAQGPLTKEWTIPPKRKGQKRPRADVGDAVPTSLRKIVSLPPKRRGKFQDEDKRAGTALTRRLHACIRCRFMRIRCDLDPDDPDGQCTKCRSITRPIYSNLPCLRWIITDVSLYREQPSPHELFSKRWKSMDLVDINLWASPEIRTVQITQTFLYAPYEVQVREFVPVEGDSLTERWSDGSIIKTCSLPPYAICDMQKTAEHLKHYVKENVVKYIIAGVGESDQLFWQTYCMAFTHIQRTEFAQEKRMLEDCLQLWVACRLTSHPEHICGEEKLDTNPIDDPKSPWFNGVPISPVMCAQLECIFYSVLLRPLNKSVLDRLQTLVMAKKRQNWFSIYIAMFILLHSCAMLTRRNREYARQICLESEYANSASIQAHHRGAQTLLAYFHFVNKGKEPFALALTKEGAQEVAEAIGLSEEEMKFVMDSAVLVAQRADDMKKIKDSRQFGHDLYWVSQLYENEWKPGPIA